MSILLELVWKTILLKATSSAFLMIPPGYVHVSFIVQLLLVWFYKFGMVQDITPSPWGDKLLIRFREQFKISMWSTYR